MEQIASVKLIEKSKASDFKQATSEVIVGDKPTGFTIDGQVLEAAVKVIVTDIFCSRLMMSFSMNPLPSRSSV
ncbi:hypothetical protein [Pantoea agglomerans]|uniref:hypothetical protein n=1 Tax=Enterobacter agglomerans TaxID=549 RepID=UPI0035237137